MRDFLLWSVNRAHNPGACQYYRIDAPMESLYKMYDIQTYQDTGEFPVEALRAQFNADIVQLYSLSGEQILHQVKTLNKVKPVMTENGMKFPPTIVYDTDDNADFVHPFNPSFAVLGVRSYPDAHFLQPGEDLFWEDADAKQHLLWVDKYTQNGPVTFDIERNLKNMKIRHEIIRNCHGATVSSPALASYFKEVIGQQNVHVYYNTIIPEHYSSFEAVRHDPDEVRILWQGSNSHFIDWFPLRGAIKTIVDKYPKVKWVIFGEWFDWVHDVIPDDRVEHHSWVLYPAFKFVRGMFNADINLCPLADNVFNRGKSAIKFYEGSIWKNPEATLAQNTGPYKEIIDNETGLLYNTPEEFVEKLSALIENVELRKRLGHAAKDWVLHNRLPEHTTPGLFDFYNETRSRHKRALTGQAIIPGDAKTLRELTRL